MALRREVGYHAAMFKGVALALVVVGGCLVGCSSETVDDDVRVETKDDVDPEYYFNPRQPTLCCKAYEMRCEDAPACPDCLIRCRWTCVSWGMC